LRKGDDALYALGLDCRLMAQERAVGVVGAILAGVGGLLLLLASFMTVNGSVEDIIRGALVLSLMVIAFVAAALMVMKRYGAGGLIGIVGGAATAIVPGGGLVMGILILLGGVLGIVAGARRE